MNLFRLHISAVSANQMLIFIENGNVPFLWTVYPHDELKNSCPTVLQGNQSGFKTQPHSTTRKRGEFGMQLEKRRSLPVASKMVEAETVYGWNIEGGISLVIGAVLAIQPAYKVCTLEFLMER